MDVSLVMTVTNLLHIVSNRKDFENRTAFGEVKDKHLDLPVCKVKRDDKETFSFTLYTREYVSSPQNPCVCIYKQAVALTAGRLW